MDPFFVKLPSSYLNSILILICTASSSKGLQSLIIHCVKRYFFLLALNLLLDYFIRNK